MTEGEIRTDLRYTKSHEWVRAEGDTLTVGITDHAQSELTDIVYVNLELKTRTFAAGAVVLVLESVKTVADVYAPVAGEVVATNSELKAHPEYVNKSPYGQGWLFRIQVAGPIPLGTLLSPDEYRAHLAAGG